MKRTKLTATKSQYKSISTDTLESDLSITVMYDPRDREVTKIISVCVFNWRTLETTDITAIMAEQFDNILDQMIDSIDWAELYAEIENVEAEG